MQNKPVYKRVKDLTYLDIEKLYNDSEKLLENNLLTNNTDLDCEYNKLPATIKLVFKYCSSSLTTALAAHHFKIQMANVRKELKLKHLYKKIRVS